MRAIRTSVPVAGLTGFFWRRVWVVLAGVLCGTVIYALVDPSINRFLAVFLDSFQLPAYEEGFWSCWWHFLAGGSKLCICCFLLGFSAIGQPLERIIPILKGAGLGLGACSIYGVYGGRGVAVILVLMLLPETLFTFAAMLASKESLKLSNQLAGLTFGGNGAGVALGICKNQQRIPAYLLKFSILFGIIVLASFLASLLTTLFGQGLLAL